MINIKVSNFGNIVAYNDNRMLPINLAQIPDRSLDGDAGFVDRVGTGKVGQRSWSRPLEWLEFDFRRFRAGHNVGR